MRVSIKDVIFGLAAVMLTGGAAAAQQVTSAPIDNHAPAVKSPAPHKPHVARKARRRPDAQDTAGAGTAVPASRPGTSEDPPPATKSAGAPANPISLGMKWNGNSDNAEQTRIQNYDGNATGSGAEVGLKLHF